MFGPCMLLMVDIAVSTGTHRTDAIIAALISSVEDLGVMTETETKFMNEFNNSISTLLENKLDTFIDTYCE